MMEYTESLTRPASSPGRAGSGALSQLYPKIKPLVMLLSFGFAACTLFRVSVFPYYVGLPKNAVMAGQFTLLIASTIYLLSSISGNLHFPSVLLGLASFCSIFVTSSSQAGLRWAGWFLLFCAAGPMIQSPRAVEFRANLWRTWRAVTVPLALGSLAAYFLPLPRIGRGFFTGLMTHQMILAPIAAMASVIAITSLRQINRRLGVVASILLVACCVICTSRSAVLCCIVAWAAAFMLANRQKASSVFAFGAFFLLLLLCSQTLSESFLATAVGRQFQHKGTKNTRERLWDARLADFKEHPLLGVGIGMAMVPGDNTADGGKQVTSDIEPGSSWLCFLSMMGTAGSLAYAAFILSILGIFIRRWPRMDLYDRSEAAGIAIFLGLHSFFEGYALAFASPLSLIFWLSWSRMADLAMHPDKHFGHGNSIRVMLKPIAPNEEIESTRRILSSQGFE